MIDSRFEKATLTAILVHIRRTLRTSNPIQVVGFSFMEFFNSCAVILKTDTRTIFEVSTIVTGYTVRDFSGVMP